MTHTILADSQSSGKEWPSVKRPIQVVEIVYLDKWKVRARNGRSKDYSKELHSDEQSADRRLSFTDTIYNCLRYQQHKAVASASRLVVELG